MSNSWKTDRNRAGRRTLLVLAVLVASAMILPAASPVPWKKCLSQDPSWYESSEAIRIAENVLLFQRDNGGWAKNIDMAVPLSREEADRLRMDKGSSDTTIDNQATHTQIRYLSLVQAATGTERFRDGALRGIDFLLKAQYPNGGWPQYFPLRSNYSRHITFNDDAMIGVMELLRDLVRGEKPYDYLDPARRAGARKALDRGLDVILKCQVHVDGQPTAWCAQHHEEDFSPCTARTYELPSLSGQESVGIVRYLMGIEVPDREVARSIEAAVRWFQAVRLTGIRVVQKPDPALPGGFDRVVVQDDQAPPLWARFYEIGTNRPIYCGRDGVPKSSLAEIEHERRVGYSWLGFYPQELLEVDYPAWKARINGGAYPSKERTGTRQE